METTLTRFDRLELKFVVTAAQRAHLGARLAAHMLRDPFADAAGRYPVISLYYDNAAHDLYWEQVRGIGSRRKLRVRLYGGGPHRPAVSFVEVKHKLDGRTVKRRAPMPVDEALAVCRGETPHRPLGRTEAVVVEEAHRMAGEQALAPMCLVRYEREALRGTGDAADLRVTFDDHIRYRLDHLVPQPDDRAFDNELLPPGMSILEVKVDHNVPFWLAEAIGEARCVLQSHSKYGHIVERQGLPHAGQQSVPHLTWEVRPPNGLEAAWTCLPR